MKKRSFISLVLALVMVLSVLPVGVHAAEAGYVPTDSYALNYNGVYEGSKWQYFSPYWAEWTYEGRYDYEALISFTLCNTRTGEGFPVYCTDIATGLDNNSNFRRINLEDSTYHAGGAAGVLRSVILKGYPNVTAEELGAAAGVENLTVGEAVSATQLAVWQVTHGNRLKITDFCYYIDTEWTPSATEHYAKCNAEIESGYASAANEALIESHIEQVYAYLITLAPTPASGVAVSNASFKDWSEEPIVTENEDGTCDVTVSATVDVQMSGADSMTLTAQIGGYHASTAIFAGRNSYTLTIPNVPAEVAKGEVKLAIDGTQTVSDVFLFDAVGDRGSSQSLIGKDDSQLPVHAEITVQPERVITFTKTGNGIPLEGIQFDIYFVADRTKYLQGEVDLPEAPQYKYTGNPDYTVTTDAEGKGSFSLTKNNMPDGVYLVVEKSHPAIKAPVEPFYVILPATSPDGTHLEYQVDIHPKNEVYADVTIEKDVISLGNDSASVDAYKNHTWIIGASIPKDIANGKSYVISDTLDNRLDYVGNLKVQLETTDGAQIKATLNEGSDYTLTVNDVNSVGEGNPSDSFTVSLSRSGMVKIANAVDNDFAGHKIRVYFDAQINANAQMGVEIPNQATLNYTNSVGVGFSANSDIPEVHTGAIQLLKVDADNDEVVLAGAEFRVYRPATAEEIADESIETVTIGSMAAPMIPVEFYDNAVLTGEKVNVVTSSADGKVYIYGLKYGTYYLVETKAPAGYNLLAEPVELIIDEDSHLETSMVTVENVSGTVLPETGGVGTQVFLIPGLLLIAFAGVLLIQKKQRSF